MQPPAYPPATPGATDPSQKAVEVVPRSAVMMTTGKNGVTVARDERGRLLPGNTPNPGGKHRGLATRVREMVDFDQAITTLVEIAWGKLAPASRVADRIKAIELLFDRGFGKAQQAIELKGGEGAARVGRFKTMSTEQLVATVHAMRALAEGKTESEQTDAE